MEATTAKGSITAAAILAGIVLFVFFTLRDFGPESAIRRFHEDLLSGNYEDLQQVSSERVNEPSVQRLQAFVRRIEETGATPRFASMERSPDEVDVLVLYDLNGGSQPFVWVVSRHPAGWEVNATETIRANAQLQNG